VLADIDQLPYITALFLECTRVYPTWPYILLTNQFEGVRISNVNIPAKSDICINLRQMMLNSQFFSNPHVIYPERWLDPDGQVCSS
jgi:cytochrome P450